MSELKAYELKYGAYGMYLAEDGHKVDDNFVNFVYPKAETDKVIAEKAKEIARLDDLAHAHNIELLRKENLIAELKKKINEAQTELELWRDGSIISEAHQKELDGKRHSDYKRCLAMAKWCEEAYNRECGLNPEEMTNKEFYKQQTEFWPRWNSKWIKIAEQFKEAK